MEGLRPYDTSHQEQVRKALRAAGGTYDVRSGRFRSRPEVRLADTLANLVAKVRFGEDGPDYRHLMLPWFVELSAVQEKAPATPSGIRGRA